MHDSCRGCGCVSASVCVCVCVRVCVICDVYASLMPEVWLYVCACVRARVLFICVGLLDETICLCARVRACARARARVCVYLCALVVHAYTQTYLWHTYTHFVSVRYIHTVHAFCMRTHESIRNIHTHISWPYLPRSSKFWHIHGPTKEKTSTNLSTLRAQKGTIGTN